MENDRPTYTELKTLWRKHLQRAELELQDARAKVKHLEEELGVQATPSPDLHFAYQQALRAETLALEKYTKVLVIVTDLLLHDKIPDEKSGLA